MNAISISFGLFIALFAILLLCKMRKLKPQFAWYRSQLRMCPSCGLINISAKSMLLGVWQGSCSGERGPDSREIKRPVQTAQIVQENEVICRTANRRAKGLEFLISPWQ
jgi:hypothetical protein